MNVKHQLMFKLLHVKKISVSPSSYVESLIDLNLVELLYLKNIYIQFFIKAINDLRFLFI